MKTIQISNFKKRINFWKKTIIPLGNVEADARLQYRTVGPIFLYEGSYGNVFPLENMDFVCLLELFGKERQIQTTGFQLLKLWQPIIGFCNSAFKAPNPYL
jgi:hypothetical protein